MTTKVVVILIVILMIIMIIITIIKIWAHLSLSSSPSRCYLTNVRTCWRPISTGQKNPKKHAVTKHLLIEHCQQLWEPTSDSGAVFSVACATTRRVFASQPLSGILVQTHQIHFLLLRLPSTEEKKRFTKLQRGDWQTAVEGRAATSRFNDKDAQSHLEWRDFLLQS